MFLAHRLLIAATTVVFLVAAIGASYLVTPVFRAEVLLAPVAGDGEQILNPTASRYLDLAGISGVGQLTQERAQLIAALRSREFTYEFIRDQQLLPALFPRSWDQDKKKWRESALPDTPTMWQAYELFDSRVRSIHLDEDSGLVTLAIEWPDPHTAASWANSLVERANRHLSGQAIGEGRRSMEYLSRELQNTTADETRDAIYSLMELQLRRVMLASVRDEFAFKVLDSAVAPETPVRPNRRIMALAGLAIGFCIGLLGSAWSDRGKTAAAAE